MLSCPSFVILRGSKYVQYDHKITYKDEVGEIILFIFVLYFSLMFC